MPVEDRRVPAVHVEADVLAVKVIIQIINAQI